MSTASKNTSVHDLRRQLKLRFQDELMNSGQGPSEVLSEIMSDAVDGGEYPLFGSFLSRMQRERLTGRRVPSRSEGAAPSITFPNFDISPPLTSRGVTNRHSTETLRIIPHPALPRLKLLGGYDGGFEVGFTGTWSDYRFKSLVELLEDARICSETENDEGRYVKLGGIDFAVQPHGCKFGAYYKYILEGAGMKVYIHANPKGTIQGIRVRYGFESLVGRDLFQVHAEFLEWQKAVGFQVDQETISRADFQTLIERAFSEFNELIQANQVVMRGRDGKLHWTNGKGVTSFTVGSKIQLKIYDKVFELMQGCDEVKTSLLMGECLGGEMPEHLTRVEFSLRREALQYFGITTVQDLLEKEHALVDYLTNDWFRLLEGEKQSEHGHERRQKIHPLWQEVRSLFLQYFPGVAEARKPIEKNLRGRRTVKCTAEALIKQAVGCLATAGALVKGVFDNEVKALAFVADVVGDKAGTLFNRIRERAIELGIVRGVEAPDALDWSLDPRYACDESASEAVSYQFRVEFNEDLQYDRVREYAVAGCPF